MLMKPRFIITASLIALIVFLLVQFYTIINVFQVRSNDFDTRYNQMIREAMDELSNFSPDQGLDSMYYYMNELNYYFKDMDLVEDAVLADSLKKVLVGDVMRLIEASEPFSSVISFKLNEQGMDPNLKAGFIIHDFGIVDGFSVYPIIERDTLMLQAENPIPLNLNLRGSLLDNFRSERDYFALNFDVYVDFTKKRQVIFGEMIGVLIFMTISILIIALVFYFTIRNLMKQKKISDLKTDFINNMTHELKTPLSTISLATQGLTNNNMRVDDDRIEELAEIIKRQNKHLTQIIDQILDISMWEKQRIKLDLKQIEIVQFIKDKIEGFKMVHKDVDFKIFIPRTSYLMHVDAFQLSIAINNLLDNAVKYKKDSLKLIVDLMINKDEIILKISDNGIGISQADQKNIFGKFYRVDTTSIHNIKGLGLGLFYVKSIIEAHGGEIWLESDLGKGTTFFIKFNK